VQFSFRNTRHIINLKYLNVSGCKNLISIPDTLINLVDLDCSHCEKLETLPKTFVKLTMLDCSITHLANLPSDYVNLTTLKCMSCINLTKIPETYTKLCKLYCEQSSIINIPSQLDDLSHIYCSDCLFEEIYIARNNVQLYCHRCVNLKKIICDPFVTFIDTIACRNCPLLLEVPMIFKYIDSFKSNWIEYSCEKYTNDLYFVDYVKNYQNNIQKLKVLQRWVRRNIKFWIFKRWIKSEEGVKWLYDPCRLGGRISKHNIEQNLIKR